MLDHHHIKATFGFVTEFTFSREQYHAFAADFRDVMIGSHVWRHQLHLDIQNDTADGWFSPESLAIVQAAGVHEIASHGFTHLPLDAASVTEDEFLHELAMVAKHSPIAGQPHPTFIYPRNLTGYADLLPHFGFIGYRAELPEPVHFTRFLSLVNELRLWESADAHSADHRIPIAIPPGRFLNWRSGLRRPIPLAVTIRRWAHLIDDAIANDGVVHLWTHPHNFITGSDMFVLFDAILKRIATAVAEGKLQVVTQQEYCLQRLI